MSVDLPTESNVDQVYQTTSAQTTLQGNLLQVLLWYDPK